MPASVTARCTSAKSLRTRGPSSTGELATSTILSARHHRYTYGESVALIMASNNPTDEVIRSARLPTHTSIDGSVSEWLVC